MKYDAHHFIGKSDREYDLNRPTCNTPCAGPEEGEHGVRNPPPPPKSQNDILGFLSTADPDPLQKSQSYQANIQCWDGPL